VLDVDDARLMIEGLGNAPMRLLAQGNHEFRARFDPSVRVVFRVENERVRSLTLHRFATVLAGRRVKLRSRSQNLIGNVVYTPDHINLLPAVPPDTVSPSALDCWFETPVPQPCARVAYLCG
jgi:hypothetical protein